MEISRSRQFCNDFQVILIVGGIIINFIRFLIQHSNMFVFGIPLHNFKFSIISILVFQNLAINFVGPQKLFHHCGYSSKAGRKVFDSVFSVHLLFRFWGEGGLGGAVVTISSLQIVDGKRIYLKSGEMDLLLSFALTKTTVFDLNLWQNYSSSVGFVISFNNVKYIRTSNVQTK